MIGQFLSDANGVPLGTNSKTLTASKLTLPDEVEKLFLKVQTDYQTAYMLQNKPYDEFDGISLMQRSKRDQETFAAFVGLVYVAKHNKWRWTGRKNTARNKLMGILAHMIAGMLYPMVVAQNDKDEEDRVTAQAMRILVEEKLKKANYDIRFYYGVLACLVNPAGIMEVEYVEELMTIRQRLASGEMDIRQVVDEAMSGLFLHIIPIDEIMFGDFYSGTGDVQIQPFIIRERRISWDKARAKYAGKHFWQSEDLFDFVAPGQTHCIGPTDQSRTLYDVESSEADANFVQELTIRYRKEDLEFTYVGGVGMFDYAKPYENPMTHRRMVMGKDKSWYTIPMYPFAMSGYEPIDPTGRFLWFKSGAFKEYWDDQKMTQLERLLIDGIKLDVMKPMFLSGVSNFDQYVMAPGSTTSLPQGATATAYSLNSNLVQAYQAVQQAEEDMSQSTQDKIMEGATEAGVTATQTNEAKRNARIMLGNFGLMIANFVTQIGELVCDCVIQNDTVGELDELAPSDEFRVKYRTVLARGKEKGKEVTNKMVFTDQYMGRSYSEDRIRDMEWDLYEQSGGEDTDQRIWMINPYRFARNRYSFSINPDQMISKSMGFDRAEKELAFEKFMDPRVMPFIDPEAVVQDFVIEEYSDGQPERYRNKNADSDEMMQALLGQAQGTQGAPQPTG